jgi:hypothetical protein
LTHFLYATDMIRWLRKQPLRRAVLRALDQGTVELLGGFRRIPPGSSPGFILKVVSKHGTIYTVAIKPRNRSEWYAYCMIEPIPWTDWDGREGRTPPTLYEGDYPDVYAQNREAAKAKE